MDKEIEAGLTFDLKKGTVQPVVSCCNIVFQNILNRFAAAFAIEVLTPSDRE
jgi:hypothetical protein